MGMQRGDISLVLYIASMQLRVTTWLNSLGARTNPQRHAPFTRVWLFLIVPHCQEGKCVCGTMLLT